jgi:hypothetical protein
MPVGPIDPVGPVPEEPPFVPVWQQFDGGQDGQRILSAVQALRASAAILLMILRRVIALEFIYLSIIRVKEI